MKNEQWDNRSYRGLLQSDDGVISKIVKSNEQTISFQTQFGLSKNMIARLKHQPEHIVFSERSRIARLGIQITCEPPTIKNLKGRILTLAQVATQMIPGYPGLDELRTFFDVGLPVGRMVFCDPEALLTSDEVLEAIDRSELKLPESTSISSDGSIVIAPHKVIYKLRNEISEETFGRILLRKDGRELLNRFQVQHPVTSVAIPPGEGIITTCSMYLNEHYVVLQSGFALGRNLPATVLDPIKTRGIRIYLEIINGSRYPIVNPLISASVYGKPKGKKTERRKTSRKTFLPIKYDKMKTIEKHLNKKGSSHCHYLDKPVSIFETETPTVKNMNVFVNGPESNCKVSKAECASERRYFSPKSKCDHIYATSKIKSTSSKGKKPLVLKYFPNIMEHRDIINLAYKGKISALYFFEPSYEHGPFLSQQDHLRLEEYHSFGISVFWVCGLNKQLMIYTMRDGMGYFVVPERLANFHKSMLFAFYGSTLGLSRNGIGKLGMLIDTLIDFWGKNIGIVTGGGSGVMEEANKQARKRGVLSGANFLEITDQPMTSDVDFCQIFQSTCRHSRQKWFEVASFPIFNIGGIGSMEELGITLCNMKLSIMDRIPIILFDTEGDNRFWTGAKQQIQTMVESGRAPKWILENVFTTDDPKEVVNIYREHLQLF